MKTHNLPQEEEFKTMIEGFKKQTQDFFASKKGDAASAVKDAEETAKVDQ